MLIENMIYKYLEKYNLNIPITNRMLNYIRELDNKGRSDKELIRKYYSRKVRLISYAVVISSLFVLLLGDRGYGIYLMCAVLIICVVLGIDKDIEGKVMTRRDLILAEFPSFINKMILLVDAGLTLPAAWKQCLSTGKDQVDSPLMHEVRKVVIKLDNGYPFNKALEEFALSCRLADIAKFTGVIIQTYKKGGDQLIEVLRFNGSEAWQLRKDVALRRGSKASTKLLFPIILIFISIMILVMTPAIMQFKNITG